MLRSPIEEATVPNEMADGYRSSPEAAAEKGYSDRLGIQENRPQYVNEWRGADQARAGETSSFRPKRMDHRNA